MSRLNPPPIKAETPEEQEALIDATALEYLIKLKVDGKTPAIADIRPLVPKDVWGHPDQTKPRFRKIPPKARYTFPIVQAILLELTRGASEYHACTSVGVNPHTLKRWKSEHIALQIAVDAAKSIAITNWGKVLNDAALSGGRDAWKAAIGALRLRGGSEWSEHRRQEISGTVTHEHSLVDKLREIQEQRHEADRLALDSESSPRKLDTVGNQGVIDVEVETVCETVSDSGAKDHGTAE